MAWTFLFSDTGDWVRDSAGGFETTNGAQGFVRHQEHDELGQWIGDLEAGRRKNTTGNAGAADLEREAASYRDCYAVLERDGIIADVIVDVDRDVEGRITTQSSMLDLLARDVVDFDQLDEFGDRS